jgi:hypothetical protein
MQGEYDGDVGNEMGLQGGSGRPFLCRFMVWSRAMLPIIHEPWVRPALTVILCLAAIVLLWYGAGALFDHDPSAETGSLLEEP